jgi:hypothetical protein
MPDTSVTPIRGINVDEANSFPETPQQARHGGIAESFEYPSKEIQDAAEGIDLHYSVDTTEFVTQSKCHELAYDTSQLLLCSTFITALTILYYVMGRNCVRLMNGHYLFACKC